MPEMLELRIPLFKPLWRRILLVLVCLGWGIFENSLGNPIWALVFCAIGGFCAWQFFVIWKDPEEPKDEDSNQE